MIFINKGDKVYYSPNHGAKENGIVKKISEDGKTIFVVYKCNKEWDRYEDFTGQATDIKDLKIGWV